MSENTFICELSNRDFMDSIKEMLTAAIGREKSFPNTRIYEHIKKTMSVLKESFTNEKIPINPRFQDDVMSLLETLIGLGGIGGGIQYHYDIGADCEIQKLYIMRDITDDTCIYIIIAKMHIKFFGVSKEDKIDGRYPAIRMYLGKNEYNVKEELIKLPGTVTDLIRNEDVWCFV